MTNNITANVTIGAYTYETVTLTTWIFEVHSGLITALGAMIGWFLTFIVSTFMLKHDHDRDVVFDARLTG
jgi:hypothetical protein